MPTIVAGFAESGTAGAACQALVETYPALNVALRLAAENEREAGGEGLLADLRSLMVEIVGVQSADGAEHPDGYAARLIVSDVPVTQLDAVKALLSGHRAVFIGELADGDARERAPHGTP